MRNWNPISPSPFTSWDKCLSRTYEELKLNFLVTNKSHFRSLSRTYEELKPGSNRAFFGFQKEFIAYLRGIETKWKIAVVDGRLSRLSRTYEELKLPSVASVIFSVICLSRTYEELKHLGLSVIPLQEISFIAYLWGIETLW